MILTHFSMKIDNNSIYLTARKLLWEDFFPFFGTKGEWYELFGSEDDVGSLSSLFLISEDNVRDLSLTAGFMKIKGEGSSTLWQDDNLIERRWRTSRSRSSVIWTPNHIPQRKYFLGCLSISYLEIWIIEDTDGTKSRCRCKIVIKVRW